MGSNRAGCTIIAKNYFAAAKTLAHSFLAQHPGDKFYVLIVDEFEGYLDPAVEKFEVVPLAALDIPDRLSFCFKYSITELCTAVKGYFLEYLITEKGLDKVLYIDPDILVTSSLEGIFESLDGRDIALTPHIDVDYPDDGLLPNDIVILMHGVFNLGFIGINASENARAFLRWWQTKLYDKCVMDVTRAYFVDQKFIDLVPGLFDSYHVERNPGYNVAYWNLHSRYISRENGSWRCNGGLLYFFHFSGYDPNQAELIVTEKYFPSALARFRLSNRPDLQPLFAEYRSLLFENGHEQMQKWPYTFARFKSGEPVPNQLRIQYRNSPGDWEKYGNPFESKRLERSAVIMRMRRVKGLSPLITVGLKCKSFLRRILPV
jgi:hypothetical protein